MSEKHDKIFQHASSIAELKIRQARSMQAVEAANMVRLLAQVTVSAFRRYREDSPRKTEA